MLYNGVNMNKEKKELNREEFFSEISQLANFCDVELVRNVYYGMIKVMSRQLKAGKRIKLPDWGRFYLHNAVPRRIVDYRSKQIISLGMKKYVKFEPDDKVKVYFRGL
jgi:nucleoid DNA-binding protein